MRPAFALLGAALLGPQSAIASPTPPVLEGTIAEMTWPQLELAAKDGAVALWAIGSIEEHGRHLPLATDVYVPQALIKKIQQRLTRAGQKSVILPPYYWGVNSVTDAFPGSLKIAPETMTALISDVASSIGDAGFSRIFLITGHYDAAHNRAIVAGVKAANAKQKAQVVFVAPRSLATRLDLTPRQGDILVAELPTPAADAVTDLHAGDDETSKMLAIAAPLVARGIMKNAVSTRLKTADVAQWRRGGSIARQITPDGHLGAPAMATAAKGRAKIEDEAAAYSAAILSVLPTRVSSRKSVGGESAQKAEQK